MTSSIKTAVLFAALIALFMAVGNAIGGSQGMIIAFAFACATSLFSYWYSDKMVLKMYKARELQAVDAPQIHNMVEELCQNANIPKPKIYLIPDQSPNAFATGRNPANSAVAVTEGIMRILSPEELRGVLAHELAHIANRDILIQTIAAIFGAAITAIANMLYFTSLFGGSSNNSEEGGGGSGMLGSILIMILAPLAASLIQMAISRSREYLADESGARFSSDPMALARALDKISNRSKQVPLNANPATENMFIISPLTGKMQSLFSTHPPIEERIERLAQMARNR